MIWLIVLVVWLIANVIWNYRFYKAKQFLCIGVMFQGIFAAVPNLVVTFSECMARFEWWTDPIFISKELKADIEFAQKEADKHLKKLSNELMDEIYKEKARKKTPTKKKDVIQENIDKMTHEEKKELNKSFKGKVGKIK